MARRLLGILVILGMIFIPMFFAEKETKIKKLNNRISELERDLEYKEEVILSQGQLLTEKSYENCYCGWYEDFYYEHAEGFGAYE